MTSLRQLGKKAKKEAGKTVNQVLDANLEEAYQSTKPLLRAVLGFICTGLLLLTFTLCVFIWIGEITAALQGKFGAISSKSPFYSKRFIPTVIWVWLFLPAVTSRLLRHFLTLKHHLPKFTKFCEYVTYSTAVSMLLEYNTAIYSYAFATLTALIHSPN